MPTSRGRQHQGNRLLEFIQHQAFLAPLPPAGAPEFRCGMESKPENEILSSLLPTTQLSSRVPGALTD